MCNVRLVVIANIATPSSNNPTPPPLANADANAGDFPGTMQEVSQRAVCKDRAPRVRLNSAEASDGASREVSRVDKAKRRFDSPVSSQAGTVQSVGSNPSNSNPLCAEQRQTPALTEDSDGNTPDELQIVQLATVNPEETRSSTSWLKEIFTSSTSGDDTLPAQTRAGFGVSGSNVRDGKDLAMSQDQPLESTQQTQSVKQAPFPSGLDETARSVNASLNDTYSSLSASVARMREDLRTNDQSRPTPFNRRSPAPGALEPAGPTQSSETADAVQKSAISKDVVSQQLAHDGGAEATGIVVVDPTIPASLAARANELATGSRSFPAIDQVVDAKGEILDSSFGFKDVTRIGGRTSGEEEPGHTNVRANTLRGRSEAEPRSWDATPANAGAEVLQAVEGKMQAASAHIGPTFETSAHTEAAGRQQSARDNEGPNGPPSSSQTSGDGGLEDGAPNPALPPGVISNARLIEHVKESEISLSVRSVDFGNVSIRTAMSHEHLWAQISPEHNDLGKALASEAEVLQSKLSQEHGIRTTIEVQQQTPSFAGNSGHSQNYAPRSEQPLSSSVLRGEQQTTQVVAVAVVADGRLDIRV